MSESIILLLGGLLCGFLAGGGAQFGRFCTLTAIEDAALAGDFRRARTFGLALATALSVTQLLVALQILDLRQNLYAAPNIEFVGLLTGATLFGLGMSLVGTCGFGLVLRTGTGDIRALLSTLVVGIAAAAASGGVLAPARLWLSQWFVVDKSVLGWDRLQAQFPSGGFLSAETAMTALIVALLFAAIFSCPRFRNSKTLLATGMLLGLSVALGWVVTDFLGGPFVERRPESLTFIAPLARALQLAMGETREHVGFAVASVFGVALGSFAVAWHRDDLRWEAFDDQREMRRHLFGAILMGFGGVLAKGCTIGQGLSASSALAASAPISILCMILGARVGLYYLVEGHYPFGAHGGRSGVPDGA